MKASVREVSAVIGDIILYIWQLPQNLLGLLIRYIVRAELLYSGLYAWKLRSGLSLGSYIFVNEHCADSTILHELGHRKQSRILGPLYLLVIGIPSFLWASSRQLGLFKSKSYYWFYTEKWANKLGGVS